MDNLVAWWLDTFFHEIFHSSHRVVVRSKVRLYSILPRPHLWDFTGYVVASFSIQAWTNTWFSHFMSSKPVPSHSCQLHNSRIFWYLNGYLWVIRRQEYSYVFLLCLIDLILNYLLPITQRGGGQGSGLRTMRSHVQILATTKFWVISSHPSKPLWRELSCTGGR